MKRILILLAIVMLPIAIFAQQSPAPKTPTQTQIPCLAQQQPLIVIPELRSSAGRLRATMVLTTEQQRMTFRYPLVNSTGATVKPGDTGSFIACFPQWVRAFRSPDAVPAFPSAPAQVDGKPAVYLDPMSGPTLRAHVGDVIELTLLNLIDPVKFGDSIDRGDTGDCDQTFPSKNASLDPKAPFSYPGTPDHGGDTYPNCFHGSTTANIHFHGTHTNPNSTGDNVFLEVVSSLRIKGETPLTPAAASARFDDFYKRCEANLLAGTHSQYPFKWSDLGTDYTNDQQRLLQKFDSQPGVGQPLWPKDQEQLAANVWPQYYASYYPYCFRLPPPVASIPAAPADPHAAPPLVMSQAPGTHWYHAHKHGSTTIDASNGMSGAFIIEGKYDDDINAVYGTNWTRTQPVLVINQFGVSPNLMTGGPTHGQDKGPDFSVNGRMNPIVKIQPGEVQMWRIVNTSGRAGAYFVGPPSGFHWWQLAQDGVQFRRANYEGSKDQPFLLAAGNRADILIQAPSTGCQGMATKCQIAVQVQNDVDPSDLATANKTSIVTLEMSNVAKVMPVFAPDDANFPKDLADIQTVQGTKTIAFATNAFGLPTKFGKHTINGKQFDGHTGVAVLLNTIEEWTITNASLGISHPFHIHINPFQVTQVFDPNVTLPGTTTPKYVTDKAAATSAAQCFIDPFNLDAPPVHIDPTTHTPTTPCDPPPMTPQPRIWWDVFPIPSGLAAVAADGKTPIVDPTTQQQIIVPGYFKMRSRFVDYSGYYVIHCHILAHEDRGMMTVVEVTPMTPPFQHH
jgi:FtsP/CotA-like multicopper oxidase with cupredoxin domain